MQAVAPGGAKAPLYFVSPGEWGNAAFDRLIDFILPD
jgi:hypothetical protein